MTTVTSVVIWEDLMGVLFDRPPLEVVDKVEAGGFSDHLTPARQQDRKAHEEVLRRAMREKTIEDS